MTLKQRAIRATLWSGADIFLRQGVQFFVSMTLARLISPEAFGTLALLSVFVALASAFVDSGFSAALVQAQDVTPEDESTVFWFTVGAGALFGVCLWWSAPAIARFFDNPELLGLTGAMALNLFFGALGAVPGTLLRKRLAFREQMWVSVTASAASGGVAVFLALRGFGVWALATQILLATVMTMLLQWRVSRWTPLFVFRVASLRRLFRFGGYLLVSSLLDGAYTRGYAVLLGKWYGARELGLYNRADGTQQLPVGVLGLVLSRVAFPVFSEAAGDVQRLRRGVQLAVRGVMLLNVPLMLGLVVTAEPLVVTLFGEVWKPCVPVLQILALSGVLWPLHVINLNVLLGQGHSRLFFRLEVIKKLLGTALLVLASFWGVLGIAWSQVALGVLGFLINATYTKQKLGYGALAQFLDFAPTLLLSVLMAAVVKWLSLHLASPAPVRLALLVVAGAMLFGGLAWIMRLRALRESVGLFSRVRMAT
ncbi:MAG: lipopolysaccharide biosynthesis protein [Myxococcaceae bacterium]